MEGCENSGPFFRGAPNILGRTTTGAHERSTGFTTCYLRVCQSNSYRLRSRVKKKESPGSGYSHEERPPCWGGDRGNRRAKDLGFWDLRLGGDCFSGLGCWALGLRIRGLPRS